MPKKKADPKEFPDDGGFEVERRAPDQDGAIEVALLEGTLPGVDRRDSIEQPDVAGEIKEAIIEAVVEERAEEAVIDRIAPLIQGIQDAEELVSSLPPGSQVHWRDGHWTVYRGNSTNEHGDGKSLKRAIKSVGAKYEHIDGQRVLVAESGAILPPE